MWTMREWQQLKYNGLSYWVKLKVINDLNIQYLSIFWH